ncbi:MAG: hypothetical protein EOO15_11945 [Chitinophagaceae bacterium]|nr:MAG: hypothetical protein EOO15_11945 [Chitinophagaceae bacterium]
MQAPADTGVHYSIAPFRIAPTVETNYFEMDLASLMVFYARESALLKTSLLEGKSWEDVQEQRHRLIDIEAALHRRSTLAQNPAESPGDRDHNSSPS